MQYKFQQHFEPILPAKYDPTPPPLERSSIFDISGAEHQDKMIMTINGISTNSTTAKGNARYISQFSGGSHIQGVHSATFGLYNDLYRSWLAQVAHFLT